MEWLGVEAMRAQVVPMMQQFLVWQLPTTSTAARQASLCTLTMPQVLQMCKVRVIAAVSNMSPSAFAANHLHSS
jgi:hypothetical protein